MIRNSLHFPLPLVVIVLCMVVGCDRTEHVPPGEWHYEGHYRWRTLATPSGDEAGFRMLSPDQTGVTAVNSITDEEIVSNRHLMHGSGVAIGDINGDHLPDLYVARLKQPNVLYLNKGGMKFRDITQEAGVALDGYLSTGVVLADIDRDEDLDLLVTMLGGPGAVMLNDGTGHFTDHSEASGLSSSWGSTTITLADVDEDYDLDVYIARYKRISLKDSLPPEELTWEKVMQDESTYAPKPEFADHYKFVQQGTKVLRIELAEPDGLYLNDGDGHFTLVDWTSGAFTDAAGNPLKSPPRDWALTARFYDVNSDGFVDLYVCNDFESEDILWLGDGEGNFRMAHPQALRKISNATMSVDFADIDRDMDVDIFLTDMLSREHVRRQQQRNTRIPIPVAPGDLESRVQEMQNTLLINRRDIFFNEDDRVFAEVAYFSGVAASNWSWATSFLDVDLDGYEDILITTGHVFDIQDLDAQAVEQQRMTRVRGLKASRSLLLDFPDLKLPNVAFRNNGDRTFTFMPEGWGLGASPDISHGMALGDLDGDGDQDVVINRLNAPVAVYENTATKPRIAVMMDMGYVNFHAVDATIRVYCSGHAPQRKTITSGGQYLSGSQMIATFAVPGVDCDMRVIWPDNFGGTSVENVAPGRLYEVNPSVVSRVIDMAEYFPPEFELTQELSPHAESTYDDFARQPLLPQRLSQRGPGAAAGDLDGDGDNDLVVGAGKDGSIAVYKNDGGQLKEWAEPPPLTGDVAGIVILPGTPVLVLAAVSNYERTPQTAGDSSFIQVYEATSEGLLERERLALGAVTPGPLALADIDGDWDLDLFVGGSFLPGAYPAPVSSWVLLNTGDTFVYDAAWSSPFKEIGMVSGAVFGDVNADGKLDLVLAQDWGPIRVMMNDGDAFVDRTEEMGLHPFTGRWNGVNVGDFDYDGQLDIVGTNWGWNLQYGRDQPVRLYYGDVDANGIRDIFESFPSSSTGAFVASRPLNDILEAVPMISRSFSSYEALASASLEEMVPESREPFRYVEAKTLGTAIFLNRGDKFELTSLPQEVQFTVATGVSVMDADIDGIDDMVLSQNYFALPIATPRQDAGQGLLLTGSSKGRFSSQNHSNLAVFGEGRAVVTADFNGDSRGDVVMLQNSAAPMLYMNVNEYEKGISVHLVGPPENPAGIGATVRVLTVDEGWGPARSVTAGSGYWSQDSPVLVMGKFPLGEEFFVHVRWPGGKEQMVPLAKDQADVRIVYEYP